MVMKKYPALPPGIDPRFANGTSFDPEQLLQDLVPDAVPVAGGLPLAPPEPPMYGPELPPDYGQPATTAPANLPQEPEERVVKPTAHDLLKQKAENQVTQDVLAWLKKRKNPSLFDNPHFDKANMALYYAGLGKELPGQYFQDEDTQGKDLATGINMLNALKESKKGSASDPNSNGSYNAQLALKNYLTTNKDNPQVKAHYDDLVVSGRIWTLSQDDINKTYPKYLTAGLSQDKANTQKEQFGEREKRLKNQFEINTDLAKQRITQGWARVGISGATMVQNAAKNVKDMTPIVQTLDQLENEIPGVTTRELSDQELQDAGITTTQKALGLIPFGAGTWLQTDKYKKVDNIRQGLISAIQKGLFGTSLTGYELTESQKTFLIEKLRDPKEFYKMVPRLAQKLREQYNGMSAAAYSVAPDLARKAGLVVDDGGDDDLFGGYSRPTGVSPAPARGPATKQETKTVGGKTYIKKDGSWFQR